MTGRNWELGTGNKETRAASVFLVPCSKFLVPEAVAP
jgi:hypothetical protein